MRSILAVVVILFGLVSTAAMADGDMVGQCGAPDYVSTPIVCTIDLVKGYDYEISASGSGRNH